MTALVARQPLFPIPMSSTQRGSKRSSSRLQEKDNDVYDSQSARRPTTTGERGQPTGTTKKRKIGYDEEDDGFAFTRVKKKKSRVSIPSTHHADQDGLSEQPQNNAVQLGTRIPITTGEPSEPSKKQRNKMSFSTPNPKEVKPVRRSKRLSNESNHANGSPQIKVSRKEQRPKEDVKELRTNESKLSPREKPDLEVDAEVVQSVVVETEIGTESSGTKIALPFADTPVIRRNKAMREGKTGEGKRRSSLSFRGRRASSLIESGNSNALPHHEVEIPDFYKHIESEGLPEPRRMRQLLTWCGTRSLDSKPMGTDFEDASARSAARVIQEELLKELANRSDLSDWFAREEVPLQPKTIPQQPNPQNIKNAEKISELDEQIKRLRSERDALEALLQQPVIQTIKETQMPTSSDFDQSLLSESDRSIMESLSMNTNLPQDVTQRLNKIRMSLGPDIDAFADGIHRISQYRQAADNVASRILAICSSKIGDREREGRKQALQQEEIDQTPRKALSSVLRGISRVDR